MASYEVYLDLGLALLVGLLVGLQRERADKELGGIRTFGLIALLGAACGLLAGPLGPWIVPAGLMTLGTLVAVSLLGLSRRGVPAGGLTTEVSMLATFACGALLALSSRELGIVLGTATALLLHFKATMHGAVRALGDDDVRAIMRFALITFIVLPVLPDRAFGPLDVINPRQVWFMVVLIVGISLAAYLCLKFMDARRGVLLAGVLGGLISSTATTLGAARSGRAGPGPARAAAAIVAWASAVVFVRVLIEIGAVAPALFWQVAPRVMVLLLVSALGAYVLWRATGRAGVGEPHPANPTRLGPALVFAGAYALVLLAVAWVRTTELGRAGVYAVGVLSGLTDMDAITLSTARLARQGRLTPETAWRTIVLASAANLVFKGAAVWVIGGWRVARPILAAFAVVLLTAAGLLVLGPVGE